MSSGLSGLQLEFLGGQLLSERSDCLLGQAHFGLGLGERPLLLRQLPFLDRQLTPLLRERGGLLAYARVLLLSLLALFGVLPLLAHPLHLRLMPTLRGLLRFIEERRFGRRARAEQ
jgi:hypothetical protein